MELEGEGTFAGHHRQPHPEAVEERPLAQPAEAHPCSQPVRRDLPESKRTGTEPPPKIAGSNDCWWAAASRQALPTSWTAP